MVEMSPRAEVVMTEGATEDGTSLFEEANLAIFKLEKFLRQRETDSQVCLPLYRMRQGIQQLRVHYEANRTVCDKLTIYDKHAERPIGATDWCTKCKNLRLTHVYLDPYLCADVK